MKPEDALKKMKSYADRLAESKTKYVAVGLPVEKASSKIYGNGNTVIEVGAFHEFGTVDIPRRSFLKDSFEKKAKDIEDITKSTYKKVLEGNMSSDKALGIIGVTAENISRDSFRTNGYGSWEPVKHGGTPLFDTGTLRNSITHVVRKK